jgi:hypothetical protein
MNTQEWGIFARYVIPGRTLVRYTSDDRTFVSYGIAAENIPFTGNDAITCGFHHPDEIRITWFDGSTDAFPLCLLRFEIDEEWLSQIDILMGED